MFKLIKFFIKLMLLPMYIPLYILWALLGRGLGMKHEPIDVWHW